MVDPVLFVPLAFIAVVWLTVIALSHPRKLLYLAIALCPTQFLFFPVSTFSLSPADVLVAGSLAGLLVRLTALQTAPWRALFKHRFLVLMICWYAIGFVILGGFSRTLIRLPLAMALSVLACELLHTRKQLLHAVTAIVLAGVLDTGYGILRIARGTPDDVSRFSGMSSPNFSGMVIVAAAVAGLAMLARTRRPLKLVQPGILGGFALATLSQMAFLALLGSWFMVLRRILSPANRIRIVAVCILFITIVLIVSPLRERIVNRNVQPAQLDRVARNTAEVRWMIIRTAWKGFLMSPVFGLGYNNFIDYSRTNPTINISTGGAGYYTHNSPLEVMVEGGLVAFTLFLLHWWQYLREIPRTIRAAVRAHDTLAAACLVGVPVVFVSAILANLLLIYSFWSIAGVALACLAMLRREAWQQGMIRSHERPLLG